MLKPLQKAGVRSGSRLERKLLKSGNARLRSVLFEAAKARYRRLAASTGNFKKTIVGMARRLAVLLWRMSMSGEPYRAAA
jgi:transposase